MDESTLNPQDAPAMCVCTGTVFHIYPDGDGIRVRCADPECGRWLHGIEQVWGE